MRTMCFWNNLHQVRSKSIVEPNKLKVFVYKTTTVHNMISKSRLHHEYFVSIKIAQYVMPNLVGNKIFSRCDLSTRTKEMSNQINVNYVTQISRLNRKIISFVNLTLCTYNMICDVGIRVHTFLTSHEDYFRQKPSN